MCDQGDALLEKALKIPSGLGSSGLQQMSELTANIVEGQSLQVLSWLSVSQEA